MPSKMKTCEDYRTALRDAAAAAVQPSLELRSHLDACASCRSVFTQELQLFAAIDTGVRLTAYAEVPVSLLPRVRVHLNERSAPRFAWVSAGAAMAAVAAVVLVVVFVRSMGRGAVESNPPAVSVARNDAPIEKEHSSPGSSFKQNDPRDRPPQLRAAKSASTEQSEQVAVLVPAGQQRAMEVLLANVRQGKIDGEGLFVEHPETALQELQVAPLVVSPIEVKPLADVSAESASQNEKTKR
jgi:hypothetical protein